MISAWSCRQYVPLGIRTLTPEPKLTTTQLCAIGGWSVFVFQAQHGLGKHQDTIAKDDLIVFQQAGFYQSIISATWSLGFLKISIAFNLLRLSPAKWYTWSLWATIGTCAPFPRPSNVRI